MSDKPETFRCPYCATPLDADDALEANLIAASGKKAGAMIVDENEALCAQVAALRREKAIGWSTPFHKLNEQLAAARERIRALEELAEHLSPAKGKP